MIISPPLQNSPLLHQYDSSCFHFHQHSVQDIQEIRNSCSSIFSCVSSTDSINDLLHFHFRNRKKSAGGRLGLYRSRGTTEFLTRNFWMESAKCKKPAMYQPKLQVVSCTLLPKHNVKLSGMILDALSLLVTALKNHLATRPLNHMSLFNNKTC